MVRVKKKDNFETIDHLLIAKQLVSKKKMSLYSNHGDACCELRKTSFF
jgi:hypothetical protein